MTIPDFHFILYHTFLVLIMNIYVSKFDGFVGRKPRACRTPGFLQRSRAFYAGIDYGTSGARCTVINEDEDIVEEYKTTYEGEASSPGAWLSALRTLLGNIRVRDDLLAIAVDGTSSTALIVDEKGVPVTRAKMYNEAQHARYQEMVQSMCPDGHTVSSATSTLCKAFAFLDELGSSRTGYTLLHQSDFISFQLHRRIGHTDYNNALKVGFDPAEEAYPNWLMHHEAIMGILPKHVHAPGSPISVIHGSAAKEFGISPECVICAGTTDSIAAFLASGVHEPGQAVTSLGSTLAIKLISKHPVNDARYGVYSHRLGDSWLVGGASNTGGAVLRQHFDDAELERLTADMDPDSLTGLDYIVLPSKGERFPENDPNLMPCMEPRPKNDALFLQGMLESMARTEGRAYRLLERLGADPVEEVYTCGGGAKNPVWTKLREKCIGSRVCVAAQGEASFGSALLAKRGVQCDQ